MWLVYLALRRPFVILVGMLLTLVFGVLSYLRTPTDILPNLRVPVVVIFASYRGMPAPDMEKTVTAVLERAMTKCDNLHHIESRSLLGIGIVKVYFRSHVNADLAASQVIALVNSEMQNLPPGMLPPTIMKYDATAVPVGNLVVSSPSRDDKYLLDLADYRLREELAGIEGLASAPVYGGVFRQVQIYVHPKTLEAVKMSLMDVARAVNNQSLVIPTGEMRIGNQTYYVSSNAMAADVKDFENIPITSDGRKVVRLGDIAQVVDGTRWRTNIVHVDGKRAVYMPLLRQAGASAVRVVDNVRDFLPELRTRGVIPDDVDVTVAFDQSQYVRDALANLRFEALLGAGLASLTVLLFLGSLRGALIVALSIPLSVLAAFTGLYFAGETLNIMTLGGLALVLGRVVDDTIVDVENSSRHLSMGKPRMKAVEESAREIAGPVFMATVTTVVVFLPLTVMTGMGKYLFTPLAVSAALAMFASYIVSRTVSPMCCSRFLKPHHERERFSPWVFFLGVVLLALGVAGLLILRSGLIDPHELPHRLLRGLVMAQHAALASAIVGGLVVLVGVVFHISPWFDRGFERFASGYSALLALCLRRRIVVMVLLLAGLIPAAWAFSRLGQELFPEVDTSEFTVHLRAKGGPRVEETERQVSEIENMLTSDYRRGIRHMVSDVLGCYRSGDAAYLDELRRANPEKAHVVDEIIAVDKNPPGQSELVRKYSQEQFVFPAIIPPADRDVVLSNIGLSSRWSAIYTPNNGPHAAFVRVQVRSGFAGRKTPTGVYVERLRRKLRDRYPNDDFFFESGGMIRSILNAGAIAPVEVQVFGRNVDERRKVANYLDKQISRLARVQETYLPQGMDLPQLKIEVDRIKAARPKLSEAEIIRNVITALMSSAQLAPNFWIDPRTGNPYVIGVQYPEYIVENVQTLEKVPITSGGSGGAGATVLRLEDVATIKRTQGPVEVYRYDVSQVSQLFVGSVGNDLGRLAVDIENALSRLPMEYALWQLAHSPDVPQNKRALAEDPKFLALLRKYVEKYEPAFGNTIRKQYGLDPELIRIPKGVRVQMRGEVTVMRDSFKDMAFALALAVLLVYLVMAAQFSSWLDPLIMIIAAPLGLIGVGLALWVTGSTLNIQSGMGVLMMVGISVCNSVLLVQFANEQRQAGKDSFTAVTTAARVRLRPILMTTVATIFGLLPMAIHLRPGDEMNLPLARAVIGGITSSTLLTLFVVPVLYLSFKPRAGVIVAEQSGAAAVESEGHGEQANGENKPS